MSKNLPNMLDNTIAKIREMVDANTVVGTPITTADGITIIPVSKISVGVGGGGSDFVSKHPNKQENPFGGGAGGGVKVTPVAFLVVKEGSVRVLPIPAPANTTADRIVEQVPDVLDKLADFIDSRLEKKGE
jgi:sporulation protein YtfJ